MVRGIVKSSRRRSLLTLSWPIGHFSSWNSNGIHLLQFLCGIKAFLTPSAAPCCSYLCCSKIPCNLVHPFDHQGCLLFCPLVAAFVFAVFATGGSLTMAWKWEGERCSPLTFFQNGFESLWEQLAWEPEIQSFWILVPTLPIIIACGVEFQEIVKSGIKCSW